MKFHSLAGLFPLLEGEEFQELSAPGPGAPSPAREAVAIAAASRGRAEHFRCPEIRAGIF